SSRDRSSGLLASLQRISADELPVTCVQKRVEVVLPRDLHLPDVFLERFRHRGRQAREEVDLEGFLDGPHVRQPTSSAFLPRSLEQRGRQPEGGSLAFNGRCLGHLGVRPRVLYVRLACISEGRKPGPARASLGGRRCRRKALTIRLRSCPKRDSS